MFCPTGNGTVPVFPNTSAAPVPRDPNFGTQGRPNGRVPGNGPPPTTAGGPPAPPKPTVTISNGRDPRRASKRWDTDCKIHFSIFTPCIKAHPQTILKNGQNCQWQTRFCTKILPSVLFTLSFAKYCILFCCLQKVTIQHLIHISSRLNPCYPSSAVQRPTTSLNVAKLYTLLEHLMHFLLIFSELLVM